ncbi:MAG: hypothetical protein LBV41_13405, partial [Cytophagaceae bacterium]|nr:hypothetical protein [Cytophagaceae bacterium]
MKTFFYRFKNFAAKKCGITENDAVLVALSGGSDSVALLHLLMRMGCRCVAMHCNFH